MIREFIQEDIDQIRQLISGEFENNQCEDMLLELKNAHIVFVDVDSVIQGFILTNVYDKIQNRWDLNLYVHPSFRNQGIGKSLYQHMIDYLKDKKPNQLRMVLNGNDTRFINFIENRKFEKWYGNYVMKYEGPRFQDIDIQLIPFCMSYYEKYAEMSAVCFEQVEKDNNIKSTRGQNYKNYIESIKDMIYIALDQEGDIITSFSINGDNIDHIMVSPKYQGQHLGKKVTQYAINKLKDQGIQTIFLACLENNPKANNLYLSLGFEIIEKTVTYVNNHSF